MPITHIQQQVLKLIAANRSPESYLAGATVLHRADDSPRFSQDVDFFHDVQDSVARSAEKDATTLVNAGHGFEWLLRAPSFHRGIVTVADQKLKFEWSHDTAFRFFPVEPDKWCGYRLHDADAAVNKVLALVGRQEVRDFVDVIHLNESYLSLGALAWAACGKDPGFTPEFLLDQAGRHTAYSQTDLDRLNLREPLAVVDLKKMWLAALDNAQRLVTSLPPSEIGCLYLNSNQKPVAPDPVSGDLSGLLRHKGAVGGAWPVILP